MHLPQKQAIIRGQQQQQDTTNTQNSGKLIGQLSHQKKDSTQFNLPLAQSNETSNGLKRLYEKGPKQNSLIFQEILNTNNSKKLEKLIELFISQEGTAQQLEQLNLYELANLFFKSTSSGNNSHTETNYIFSHYVYQAFINQNQDESLNQVLRYILLSNYEQLIGKQGQFAKLLEIFQEMRSLNPDFKQFEENYQIQLESIEISFKRLNLRTLFIISIIDILKALKGSIAKFEEYETLIFSQLKQNQVPIESDLGTLIIAYVLLNQQLEIAESQGYSQQALDLFTNQQEQSIQEMRKKFLLNASKLSHKYLGQSIFVQINQMQRRGSPDHFNKSQIQPDNSILKFLVDTLNMNYYIENQMLFEVNQLYTSLIQFNNLEQLIDRLLPTKLQKVYSGSSSDFNRPNHSRENSYKQIKKGDSSSTYSSPKDYKIKTTIQTSSQQQQQQQQQQQSKIIQYRSSSQTEHQELESLQQEMVLQKKELDKLKKLYSTQQIQQISFEQSTQYQQQMFLIDALKKKIESLEGNVSNLKNENIVYKRQKESKEGEVNELKCQLSDLFEKQAKIEKLLQQQQSPTNFKKRPSNQKNFDIKIPTKQDSEQGQGQGQGQLQRQQTSPFFLDNFNFMQMDELMSPKVKANQNQLLQLLDLLDVNCIFSKIYVKYQSLAINDQAVWDSDFKVQQVFKVEAQISEQAYEGKKLLINAYQGDAILCKESISFEIVKSLINNIDFIEMLPTNMPNLSNTHQFFKYFILPFTGIVQDDNSQSFSIQIWPKPYGLLNGLILKTDFLEYNCQVYMNHIENDQFRIQICDPITYESLSIDVEMDYSSLDNFFKNAKNIKDEYGFFSKSTLLKLTDKAPKFGDDDVAEALQERNFENAKVKGVQDQKLNQSYQTEYLELKNPIEFLKYVKSIVVAFEGKLRSLDLSFSKALFGIKYYKCKTWYAGAKSQIQIINDQVEEQILQINLQNCFETFGPNKAKLKVKGETSLSYACIQREFAVNYETLQSEERLAILQALLYSFNLNVFEKQCEQTEQQFDKNPIIQSHYECGSYQRIIVFDKGQIAPVTISVIGSNRRMCGVKFGVYNINNSQEYGVFLPTTQGEWDMRSIDKQKIKASVENVPFAEYLLTQILKSQTVTKILFKKILNSDLKTNQIDADKIRKRQTFIERIDNLLTWQEVLAIVNQ